MCDFGDDQGDAYYRQHFADLIREGRLKELDEELAEELYAQNTNSVVLSTAADRLSGRIVRPAHRPPAERRDSKVIYFYKCLLSAGQSKKAIPGWIGEIMKVSTSTIEKELKKIREEYGRRPENWPDLATEWDAIGFDEDFGEYRKKLNVSRNT